MASSPLFVALFVFVTVAAAVWLIAQLWETWQRRRAWRATVAAVARQRPGSAATLTGNAVSLLREAEGNEPRWALWTLRKLAFVRALDRLMDQAAVSWGVKGFFRRAVLVGAVFAVLLLILTKSFLAALLAFSTGAIAPYLQLRRLRARRLARFEEQLPVALDLLMRAIRAGHPFSSGLKMIADESPEPLAGEFRRVFDEQKFGLSLQDSLQGLADRVDLSDVRIFVTAIGIQRQVGGNLAEILAGISETVRERFKIQRQVQVYTAQGRLTGILLSLLPVGLGILLGIINPAYMRVMFVSPVGQAMLVAAGVLQLIGYLLIRRITTIEV